MTIQKGQPWGQRIVVPLETRDVESDADLAAGSRSDIHIVSAGDVHCSLGSPSKPVPGDQRALVQVDALRCEVESPGAARIILAASSVRIGHWYARPWTRRRHVVVTNTGIVDGLNIAPRAHPNDGSAHMVAIAESMGARQRFLARRRAATGDHVPHPSITIHKSSRFELLRAHPRERLTIDGLDAGSWDRVTITVEPDCWQVIV